MGSRRRPPPYPLLVRSGGRAASRRLRSAAASALAGRAVPCVAHSGDAELDEHRCQRRD